MVRPKSVCRTVAADAAMTAASSQCQSSPWDKTSVRTIMHESQQRSCNAIDARPSNVDAWGSLDLATGFIARLLGRHEPTVPGLWIATIPCSRTHRRAPIAWLASSWPPACRIWCPWPELSGVQRLCRISWPCLPGWRGCRWLGWVFRAWPPVCGVSRPSR